jgi:hypothetical protein
MISIMVSVLLLFFRPPAQELTFGDHDIQQESQSPLFGVDPPFTVDLVILPNLRHLEPNRNHSAYEALTGGGAMPFQPQTPVDPTPKTHKTCGHGLSSRLRRSLTQLQSVRDEPAQGRCHLFRNCVLVPLCSVDILASSDLLQQILVGYP